MMAATPSRFYISPLLTSFARVFDTSCEVSLSFSEAVVYVSVHILFQFCMEEATFNKIGKAVWTFSGWSWSSNAIV
jgi:hypothetical protein